MRRHFYVCAMIGVVLLASFASGAHAEVKNVQMKIAGYLCGN
jgi:hypothetical protein